MLTKAIDYLTKTQIEYEILPTKLPEPEKITATKSVTLFHKKSGNHNIPSGLHTGDKVNTGQKLSLFPDDQAYVIAPVTGTISSISPFTGDFGRAYSAISIDIDKNEIIDNQFEKLIPNPTLDNAISFLSFAPGNPPLSFFSDSEKVIHTIIISGLDRDLLIGTNQYIVKSNFETLKKGIQILKQITGITDIIMITAGESMQGYGYFGAEVKAVDTTYPSALPHLVLKNVLGRVVPAGKTCEDLGICFFSAEAVASIGSAFDKGRIPVTKTLTFVKKDASRKIVETTIGTPIRDIFEAFGETINEKDRIIFGGPMTGSAIYALEHPVQPDTDAIIVLDREKAAYVSEYPCINCGECVRNCPAKMQVNLLIRFLEAGQYEEAADNHDLYSCVECGLCSYVCVSKIPIFQYIKLAKYELERDKPPEEATDA